MVDSLFPSSYLTTRRQSSELFIRPLEKSDFEKGYPQILSQLTELGQMDKDLFQKRFKEWQSSEAYFIIVVEDVKQKKIAGAASLFVEKKLVHNGGKVGHIEDVVVDSHYRGLDLGKKLIFQLKHIAVQFDCYKVILSCNEKNISFYQKCGFQPKEQQMACYLPVKSRL